jgi:hypothetical protein
MKNNPKIVNMLNSFAIVSTALQYNNYLKTKVLDLKQNFSFGIFVPFESQMLSFSEISSQKIPEKVEIEWKWDVKRYFRSTLRVHLFCRLSGESAFRASLLHAYS